MSVHTNNTNLNPYSNTPIKNLEYIQNKALVIAPFEITKSGLIDTDLMLDTPGFITMYFFRKNFNSVLKEPTAEQFKAVGTVSDIGTKLGLDITTGNISSSITSSYYLGSTKIAVTFKYDKNTGIRTIEKDNSLLVGDYTDISIDSTCDLVTDDYFVICNVTKNTKATNSSFTESSSMDFIFMIPSSECQEIITDFTLLDANNQVINVKKYGTLGSGFVADNDTTFEPAYQADFFGDGSNIATYLFDGTCRDLTGNYNGTATGVTYGEGKVGQAVNISTSSNIVIPNGGSLPFNTTNFSISFWYKPISFTNTNQTIFGTYKGGSWSTNEWQFGPTHPWIGNKFSLAVYNNNSGAMTLVSNTTTVLNTVYHVVITRNNGIIALYINGILDNSITINNDILFDNRSNNLPFYLGGPTATTTCQGDLDQLRIFNRALNQNEVTALYLNNASTRVIKQESNVEKLAIAYDYATDTDFFGDGSNVANYLLRNNVNDVAGKYNGVVTGTITYNGSGYIQSSTTGQVNLGNPHGNSNVVTISAWVCWNGTSGVMPFTIDKCNTLMFSGGNLGFNTGNAGDLYGISSTGFSGAWRHLIIEFHTGEYGRLWVDGVLQTLSQKVGTPDKTFALVSAKNILIFGNIGTNYRNFGVIQNIKIFNRVVSNTEAKALYSGRPLKLQAKPDFFKDGSNIATYLFNGDTNDLQNSYPLNIPNAKYSSDRFNKSGKALDLTNGYSSINLPFYPTSITSPYSTSGWYYIGTYASGTTIPLIVIQSKSDLVISADYTTGKINMVINTGANGSKVLTSPQGYLNTWIHICTSFNGSDTTLYINGLNLGTITGMSDRAFNSYINSSLNYVYKLDCLRWFNRSLNQREVLELYNEQPSYEEQLTLTEVTGKPVVPTGNPLIVYDRDIGPSIKFKDLNDYIDIPSSDDFAFGTGDFTIETWLKVDTHADYATIVSNGDGYGSSTAGWWRLEYSQARGLTFVANNIIQSATTSIPVLGQLVHIAITRNNGSILFFVNGVLVKTSTNSSDLVAMTSITIGRGNKTPTYPYNIIGSISQLHIVKGQAKYTSNFTPASRLLQTPNTVLLLQVDKPVINTDNWSKVQLESVEAIPTLSIVEQTGKVLTNTGVTTVNDTYKNNDGSLVCAQNKSISLSSTSDLILGTNDFTIELWCKWNGNGTLPVTGTQYTMFNNLLSGSNKCWDIQYYNGAYRFSPYTSGWGLTFTKDMDNNWHHIAIEKYNNTLTMYFDGVTAVSSTTLPNLSDTSVLYIGNTSYTSMENAWNGYLDDIRITNGRARYQKDFTPPTSSLVKDANTVFLLQATNPNQPLIIKDPKRKDFFGDKSMVACYMLDSNANDETGSYNGTATNITYTDGKFGKCAAGNGISSEINVSGLSIISSRTVSFWVKSNYTTVNNCAIFSSRDTGDDYLEGIVIRAGNGTLSSFIINIGVNTFDINPLDLNWNNIIIVDDTINYNVYFNGVLKITQPVQSGHKKMSSFNLFRRSGTPAPQFFDGQLDNVKIFNRALTQDEVIALYNEKYIAPITLTPQTEVIASEPDFFNDKSNIATYLFEPEILSTKYTIDKAVFEAPKSSGTFTYFGYLQFWYNNQALDIKAYLVNRNNARLELDGVVIGNLNQDNVWNSDNGIGDWNPNNIIKSSINNGSGTTNNSTKQTITLTFSKDIKIDNISYVSYLSGLPGGSNITTTLSYKGTQLFTNTDTTQYSATHNLIPLTSVLEANGKYNGTATNIVYTDGKFGKCASFDGVSSKITLPTNFINNYPFSFSGWIKSTKALDGGQYIFNIMLPGQSNARFSIAYSNNIDATKAILIAQGGQNHIKGSINISDLNHIVVIANSINNYVLYLNGVQITLTNLGGSYMGSQWNLGSNLIGDDSRGYFFGGQIDNVRIFNRALTASEVQDLYRETKRVKYKAITLDKTNFGPASKFSIETQKEIKLLNYKTWTGTDATSQGYRIYPVMKIQDHTAEETSFSPKFYLGAKYQRNLAEVLLPSIKSKRTISNLKDMYLVDDLCIQTLKKINILLENNQLIKFTERLYNLTTPIKEKLNADLILEYLSTPVSGSVNSDIAATLKTSLITDYNFTQAEIDNLNDNLNTFKSRARMNISTPVIQGTNGSLDQVKFTLPKTFVDGNRSQTEKKNLLVFGTDAGFNKFGLNGYSTPYSNIVKRDDSAVLNIDDLTLGCPVLSNYSYGIDTYTKFLLVGGVDLTGKVITYQRSLTINTSVIKFNPSSMKFVGSSPTEIDFVATSDFAMGLGDFTIDGWINTPDGNGCIFTIGIDRTSCCYQLGISGGVLYMYYGNAAWYWVLDEALTCDKSIPLNEWVHIAIQRKSGTCEIFINGIKVTSKAWAKNLLANGNLFIGTYFGYGNTYGFNGYIDSFRISKGIARYQSDFVPSSLVPMNNTFKDILTNYKQQIPFSYIPLSTDPANTNNEPVFENLTNITGFDHSEIVIDLPNVL